MASTLRQSTSLIVASLRRWVSRFQQLEHVPKQFHDVESRFHWNLEHKHCRRHCNAAQHRQHFPGVLGGKRIVQAEIRQRILYVFFFFVYTLYMTGEHESVGSRRSVHWLLDRYLLILHTSHAKTQKPHAS
jgi:hypothetical protein